MKLEVGDRVIFTKDLIDRIGVVVTSIPGEFGNENNTVTVELSGDFSLKLTGRSTTRIGTNEACVRHLTPLEQLL